MKGVQCPHDLGSFRLRPIDEDPARHAVQQAILFSPVLECLCYLEGSRGKL